MSGRSGEWQQIDKTFNGFFTEPVYVGVLVSNDYKAKTPARVAAEFDFEQFETPPLSADEDWKPQNCNLLEASALPSQAVIPPGVEAQYFSAPFALGSPFGDTDGNTFVFTSEQQKAKLVRIDKTGFASTFATTDVLAGINRKSGVVDGADIIVTVDGWGGGGNRFSGVFVLHPDGSYEPWETDPGLGGLGAILARPDGGWWLADFERDNLYIMNRGGGKLREVIKKDIPGGSVCSCLESRCPDPVRIELCRRPPFGGIPGIDQISDQGEAKLLAGVPGKKNFNGLAVGMGGELGDSILRERVG